MTRCIKHWNDANARFGGMRKNFEHFTFRQLIGALIIIGKGIILRITILNSSRDFIAAVVLVVRSQGHIVQQEAQAVITEGQFNVRIAALCRSIDDVKNLVLGKVLSAAVEVENAHEIAIIRGGGGGGDGFLRVLVVVPPPVARGDGRGGEQREDHGGNQQHGQDSAEKLFLHDWLSPFVSSCSDCRPDRRPRCRGWRRSWQ